MKVLLGRESRDSKSRFRADFIERRSDDDHTLFQRVADLAPGIDTQCVLEVQRSARISLRLNNGIDEGEVEHVECGNGDTVVEQHDEVVGIHPVVQLDGQFMQPRGHLQPFESERHLFAVCRHSRIGLIEDNDPVDGNDKPARPTLIDRGLPFEPLENGTALMVKRNRHNRGVGEAGGERDVGCGNRHKRHDHEQQHQRNPSAPSVVALLSVVVVGSRELERRRDLDRCNPIGRDRRTAIVEFQARDACSVDSILCPAVPVSVRTVCRRAADELHSGGTVVKRFFDDMGVHHADTSNGDNTVTIRVLWKLPKGNVPIARKDDRFPDIGTYPIGHNGHDAIKTIVAEQKGIVCAASEADSTPDTPIGNNHRKLAVLPLVTWDHLEGTVRAISDAQSASCA